MIAAVRNDSIQLTLPRNIPYYKHFYEEQPYQLYLNAGRAELQSSKTNTVRSPKA
jgi:hypothetical protein